MSFIQFTKNGQLHTDKLDGDNDLHIFDIPLTDIYLEKYEELINEPVSFNDITCIHLFKNNDIITSLPNSLKSLYIKSGTLTELPIDDIVANNIEIIYLDFTNLNKFPDISKCVHLRELTINHSHLTSLTLDYPLPPTLQVLNLRYNNIQHIDCDLFKTHPNLKLNISYNNLDDLNINNILNINRKTDIKMQNRYTFKEITITNYNNIDIARLMVNPNNIINHFDNIDNTINKNGGVLANNTQTVHLSSINKSVAASYNNILKYSIEQKLDEKTTMLSYFLCNIKKPNTIEEVISEFKKYNYDKADNTTFTQVINLLNKKRHEKCEHSLLKITYIQLLTTIWIVVKSHTQRENLVERLYTEISDSIDKCFTGCMNRLINVLVGYIPGVTVSISVKEEIQMSIQTLIRKLNDNNIDYKTAKENMITILNAEYTIDENDPNDIISDEYKNAWLSGLNDFRPDAILCKFNIKLPFDNSDKQNTWYYISYDDLLYDSLQNFEEEKNPFGRIVDHTKSIAQIFAYMDNPEQLLPYMLK
jgi:hypothetical protein